MLKTKCFAYLRVSGKSQVEGDGFPRQRASITAYAKKNDLQVVEFFEERGLTGKTEFENRDAWMAMIDKLNGVKTIIVENLSRLARDLVIQEMIVADLIKRDVRLISAAGEETNNDDAMRVLLRQIMGAMHQYEASQIAAKLRAARNRKKEATGKCEGRKSFGFYSSEKDTLERLIYLHNDGYNPSLIAIHLNAENRPTRKGTRWLPYTVSRIIAAQSAKSVVE